ncbi:MAG: hypothetical protein JNL82_17490 [Myxococcales bacterium]|nr:hypothetical protein [Myxococcales bacterium]
MIINPNNRIFDRVPDIFNSPFPGADVNADDAFKILMQRVSEGGQQTIGEAILSQAGAQAWNQATQMLWKTKATLGGDLLGDVWSKVSWIDPKTDSIAGMLAEIPFAATSDPVQLIGAMANVAVDIALNAISAVPVAGWIIGIAVGFGRALAGLFKGLRSGDSVPPEQRARLPWGAYNETVDQEWVRTFINIDAAGVNWTPLFAPPTDAIPWTLVDGVDKRDPKNVLGKILAPFVNKTVRYNGMYGCLPGTFRVAGLVQHRNWNQPPNSELRFYGSGEIVQQYGEFTQTGDFFPALQQLAGTTWQQIAAGGPDAYKVDCAKIERLWRDWFTALYESAMEQGHGDYLLPYLARKVHGEWRLGANASGIYRPTAPNGKYVPLVTAGTFKDGVLATPKTRAGCWFTDGLKDGKRYAFETAQKWPYDEKSGAFQAPPASKFGGRSGYSCVPWPPAELLLSQYKRADEVITTPAARAVAQLQRRRLSRSLDCAYVRPLAADGRPAYAAFVDNRDLRDHCIEMRKRLLKHPARMGVEYETVREVDKEYAELLRQAGVPTTAAQRATAKFGMKLGANAEPLDPKEPAPDAARPLMGGLPFDPGGDEEPARSWLGPVLVGGAAVTAAIGAAIAVKRWRAARV